LRSSASQQARLEAEKWTDILAKTRCSWNAQVFLREDADQGEDSDWKGNRD